MFAGIAARVFSIWIGRPEFVGWFNHSYYYWVQIEGLLQHGQLPFADLPLILHLYAAMASLFQLLGLDMAPAIVNSTRFVMSIVPALIALPTYGLVRRIIDPKPIGPRHWVLVALSAFFPLTLLYMPELLQKNCLGLSLLGGLMYATHWYLRTRSRRLAVAGLALFSFIAVTHVGTLVVTLLFGLCLLLAVLFDEATPAQVSRMLGLILACSAVSLIGVYLLDVGAFDRILLYFRSSLPNSLLGGLFSSQSAGRKLMFGVGIGLPLAVPRKCRGSATLF